MVGLFKTKANIRSLDLALRCGKNNFPGRICTISDFYKPCSDKLLIKAELENIYIR